LAALLLRQADQVELLDGAGDAAGTRYCCLAAPPEAAVKAAVASLASMLEAQNKVTRVVDWTGLDWP
jgi:hypothetical protein